MKCIHLIESLKVLRMFWYVCKTIRNISEEIPLKQKPQHSTCSSSRPARTEYEMLPKSNKFSHEKKTRSTGQFYARKLTLFIRCIGKKIFLSLLECPCKGINLKANQWSFKTSLFSANLFCSAGRVYVTHTPTYIFIKHIYIRKKPESWIYIYISTHGTFMFVKMVGFFFLKKIYQRDIL